MAATVSLKNIRYHGTKTGRWRTAQQSDVITSLIDQL
jgi:hypothetical protein